VALLTGLPADADGWLVAEVCAPRGPLRSSLQRHHGDTPRRAGLAAARDGRRRLARAAGHGRCRRGRAVGLESSGEVVRTASTVRLATHRVARGARRDVQRLLDAIDGDREASRRPCRSW
jgi:hypothetical protein